MTRTDWESVTDFERHPSLKMEVGDEVEAELQDDGNFVSKKQMQDAGAKFARDCNVFVVKIGEELKEFWIATTAYSTMRQLKRIRDENDDSLKGTKVRIKRVSDKTDETNYEITRSEPSQEPQNGEQQ